MTTEEVRKEREAILNETSAVEKRYIDAHLELDKRQEKLQEECSHPEEYIKYQSDPYHSYYECLLCGKEELTSGEISGKTINYK